MQLTCTPMMIALLAVVAAAQDGRGPGRGRFAPNIAFTLLDTDGDGILEAAEIDAAPQSLAKLDKNSDGQITSDEVRAAMPQGRGRGGPGGGREGGENSNAGDVVEETVKMLMTFDANGDGKLSKSELPERFQGIFDRGDENHDGFLTPDEIRKVAAAQAAPAASAGRGGREGGDINFIRVDPILAAIDSDGDGVISATELRAAPQSIRKLDKDGDGKVTREEAMPGMGRGRA